MKYLPISEIQVNPENPRTIKNDKFKKLVNSIKEFPEMLEARPIVINKDFVILGGNMRYKAVVESGLTEIPVKIVDWSEEKQREFIIKDNVSGGEWDWDALAKEWDEGELEEWGLDIPGGSFDDETYSKKIKSIIYEVKGEKPELSECFDSEKASELIDKINESDIEGELKEFLIFSAYRHIVFNYENIAEYFAHSDKKTKELFEQSALVIVDYEKAVENGYAILSKFIYELIDND